MDANQRECLDEHLSCVYLCPFAVENSTSRFVFFNKDFVRISVLSKVGFQSVRGRVDFFVTGQE